MKKLGLLLSTGVIAALAHAPQVAAQTEIAWWHAMDAELGKKLEEIATGQPNRTTLADSLEDLLLFKDVARHFRHG